MSIFLRTVLLSRARVWISFRLLAVTGLTLCLGLGVCPGNSMGFLEFQRINQENNELVRTGDMRIQCDLYQRQRHADPAILAQQEDQEWHRLRQTVLRSPGLTEERKEAKLKLLRESHLRRWQRIKENPEIRDQRTETLQFNQGTCQLRRETRMTRSTNPEKVTQMTTIQSDGQVALRERDRDLVLVNSAGSKSLGMLPSQLGTVHPSQLQGISEEDVSISTGTLDEHPVIIYDVQREHDHMRIYADPSLGYRYRKVELFRAERLAELIVARDYRLFDDIPLPTCHEAKMFAVEEPNTPIWWHETTRIMQAALNRPIDPNLFKIECKPSTRFQVAELGIFYRPFADRDASDLILSSLGEIIDMGIGIKAEKVMTKAIVSESLDSDP